MSAEEGAGSKKPDRASSRKVKEASATEVEVGRYLNALEPETSDAAVQAILGSIYKLSGVVNPLTESIISSGLSGYTSPLGALATSYLVGSSEALIERLSLRPQLNEFESEVAKLRSEVDQKAQALLNQRADARKNEEQIKQLKSSLKELNDKQRLAHLLSRVGDAAQKRLLESEEFRSEFNQDAPRNAYVLSIDIRRSTELMLKAREPKLFAQFIITLATRLRHVILENNGIFDKFTGDGILAFFPEFFSGPDAGYLCVKSAAECHNIFTAVYKEHRHCFASILTDTGLGIGIDYGAVQLVQIGGDFTVVGTPVVYACRMSGATAGTTLVNQPAFEKLFDMFSEYCDFEETFLEIKHEGRILGYKARLNGKSFKPSPANWLAPVNTSGGSEEVSAGTQADR
jgi:class 3 adenylate cyclase